MYIYYIQKNKMEAQAVEDQMLNCLITIRDNTISQINLFENGYDELNEHKQELLKELKYQLVIYNIKVDNYNNLNDEQKELIEIYNKYKHNKIARKPFKALEKKILKYIEKHNIEF